MNIGAIIITYNPQIKDLFDNILTYSSQVNQIVIVDNSTDLLNKSQIRDACPNNKIVYLDMKGNKGVATALNAGFEYVMMNGADWVLTMDQDSCFVSSIDGYKSYILNHDVSNLLLLAPIYHFYDLKQECSETITNLKIAIQSGCLVNVSNYLKNGSYREDFFIDFVDYEYCLRGNSKKLILFQIHSVLLKHSLGEKRTGCFLNFKFNYCSSIPMRYYYVIRNGLKTAFIYKNFNCVLIIIKTVVRVLLLEDNKKKKFSFILKGVVDSMIFKYGKFSESNK